MPLLCLLQLSKIRKKLISQKTTDFGETKKNTVKKNYSRNFAPFLRRFINEKSA
jgi:hypothetical protein